LRLKFLCIQNLNRRRAHNSAMARPKLPLELLKLRGTYRPSRHGPETADDGWPRLSPVPPSELSDAEKQVWLEVVPHAPHLRGVDKRLVAMYCKVCVERNVNLMLKLSKELRLTPQTRPRVGAPRPVAGSDWAKLKSRTDQLPGA
jgi:hypothetical protein